MELFCFRNVMGCNIAEFFFFSTGRALFFMKFHREKDVFAKMQESEKHPENRTVFRMGRRETDLFRFGKTQNRASEGRNRGSHEKVAVLRFC